MTKTRIEALLQGPFAETIEKFTFDGCSIANVTSEEFQLLGMQFRYFMTCCEGVIYNYLNVMLTLRLFSVD